MKRSPLKRRRSPRLDSYRDELVGVAPQVIRRAMGMCEICKAKAGDVIHHRKLRSQGGTNALANLMLLCDACHRYVHGHPAMSYAAGYLLHRSDPEVPLSKGESYGSPMLAE
jgi:5-methylcytosine-specific restriction endonuclease McrA